MSKLVGKKFKGSTGKRVHKIIQISEVFSEYLLPIVKRNKTTFINKSSWGPAA